MGFIPTYCDGCSRSQLLDEATVSSSGGLPCQHCGGQRRCVPGSIYSSADLELYDELAQILREAGISLTNAAQLQALLVEGSDAPRRNLRTLAQTLPGLVLLETLAERDPRSVQKAEGMLRTILEGIASQRRHSGFIQTAAEAASHR